MRLPSANAPRSNSVAAVIALVLGVASAPQVMAQSAPDTSAAPAPSTNPALQAGPVTLLFGGFTELATIYRNKDESTDVGSSFGGVPMGNTEQSNLSEFRESARQSRLSILAQTHDMGGYKLETWFEMDFLGAAPTANSNESNSYTPRMRNIYGRFISDSGWYVMGGQNWSLVTLEKKGMDPRDEDAPLTIDAQYVAGFSWTRNPQMRFVDKVADGLWLGLSLESPQATGIVNTNSLVGGGIKGTLPASPTTGFAGTGQLGNGGGTCTAATTTTTTTTTTSGTATSTSTSSTTCSVGGSNFSTDVAPDVVAKVAADPGYGHYELFGLARWFRSAIAPDSQTTMGGGVGAGAILPLVPNILSFQLSGLVGKGIGRYGSASLNDVVVKPDGQLAPVQEYQVLAGLIYTPNPSWQAYLYAGREQQSKTLYQYGTATAGPYWYGLGIPNLNNSGCYTLNGTCSGQNQKVDEVTGGFWWKFYRGALGNAQFGLQAGYIQRTLFEATGGAPAAGMFEGMASFRIYPYQK
ncbi:MAG TPA: hypothetical protein VHW25_18735 [Steroidobacteraceae bacterium]|jgi:hypothetical protein|nr:hypothetical protein [Steroidobacteraceae bacterium]